MRLFVAIPFDASMKEGLKSLTRELQRRGFRGNFTRPENLHLTLAFIGETRNVRGVARALERVEGAPFEIRTRELGHFRDLVWLGLEDCPELNGLAASVRQSLDGAGVDFDRKAFVPHVTLARRANLRDLGEDALPEVPAERMLVSGFSLMSSERVGGQLVYRRQAHFPLREDS